MSSVQTTKTEQGVQFGPSDADLTVTVGDVSTIRDSTGYCSRIPNEHMKEFCLEVLQEIERREKVARSRERLARRLFETMCPTRNGGWEALPPDSQEIWRRNADRFAHGRSNNK